MTFSSGNATYATSSLVSWYRDFPRFRWPSMSRMSQSDLTFDPSDDLYYSSLVFVSVFVAAIGAVFILIVLTYLLIFWKCLPKWRDHFDYDYSKYENSVPRATDRQMPYFGLRSCPGGRGRRRRHWQRQTEQWRRRSERLIDFISNSFA